MKIAITSKGTNVESEVDPQFGRAAYILIVDSENLQLEMLDNKVNVYALKGAGIQAASLVSDKGVEVLLTGFCGPNVFKILNAAGIKVANDVTGTVREAIDMFNEGEVSFSDGANEEEPWKKF